MKLQIKGIYYGNILFCDFASNILSPVLKNIKGRVEIYASDYDIFLLEKSLSTEKSDAPIKKLDKKATIEQFSNCLDEIVEINGRFYNSVACEHLNTTGYGHWIIAVDGHPDLEIEMSGNSITDFLIRSLKEKSSLSYAVTKKDWPWSLDVNYTGKHPVLDKLFDEIEKYHTDRNRSITNFSTSVTRSSA